MVNILHKNKKNKLKSIEINHKFSVKILMTHFIYI